MARVATYSLFSLIALAAAACGGGEDPPATDDPECQIQQEAERSPGYPYDLAKYTDEVLPVVVASCGASGCHGAPAGQGGFTVWAGAAPGNCDYAKTFNTMSGFIDLANPENSALLVAISGSLASHPVQYQPGDPNLATLTAYVQDASDRFLTDGGGGNTPPPGASPFDYAVFQDVIQPVIDGAEGRGCATSGCHGTGAAGFTLVAAPARDSDEMEANFLAVTSRANLTTPETSLFYLKSTIRHAAGASALASADQGADILAWIQDAKDNGGGGPVAGCAPVDRFNVAVFRDEILPILRGELDINNPGQGGGTGCTSSACHGAARGPGVLYLSPTVDANANLEQFACFVDLLSPSASEILLCPQNDSRCRVSPHPGQDVFSGADDLNYQRLLAFLYGSRVDSTPLDFAFFARRVNSIFNDLEAVENGAQGRTCASSDCHGVSVVGQSAPNGSNFPIIANASDLARLTYNFSSSASFVNFLAPDQSSLFLYPTNEIANLDNPSATGLPHPGGIDFAVNDAEALNILRWAGGLRPDNQGFVTDWLVAGDYNASRITDLTPIDEINSTPKIFDPTGASQFNAGEWDGLFSAQREVDLNAVFPRDATSGRSAYAVAYIVNTTGLDITAQMTIVSENAVRVWVDKSLVAQADDASNGVAAIAQLPGFNTARKSTRVLIKLFQNAADQEFSFSVQLRDELGNLLTNDTAELVVLLGPTGGI